MVRKERGNPQKKAAPFSRHVSSTLRANRRRGRKGLFEGEHSKSWDGGGGNPPPLRIEVSLRRQNCVQGGESAASTGKKFFQLIQGGRERAHLSSVQSGNGEGGKEEDRIAAAIIHQRRQENSGASAGGCLHLPPSLLLPSSSSNST